MFITFTFFSRNTFQQGFTFSVGDFGSPTSCSALITSALVRLYHAWLVLFICGEKNSRRHPVA